MRLGGVAGILAPVPVFTSIGLAIATHPSFSWLNNALSDLGVVPGITSLLFNFGLLVSGLLSFSFGVGLYNFLNRGALGKMGTIIFSVAGIALTGIGVAPENAEPFHIVFSVAFFSLLPISLLVISGYWLISRENRFALFSLLVALLALSPWILFSQIRYVQGIAIPELFSGFAGAIWIVFVGWKMFKISSKARIS